MPPIPSLSIELSSAGAWLVPGLLQAGGTGLLQAGGTVASLALLEAVLSADNAVALAGIVQSVASPGSAAAG